MRSALCSFLLLMTLKAMAYGGEQPQRTRLPLAKMACENGVTAVYGLPKTSGRTFFEGKMYKSIYLVNDDGAVELYIKGVDGEPTRLSCRMTFWNANN